MKNMKVALVLTGALLLSGISFAQGDWRWQRDHDRQGAWDPRHSKEYNKGVRDGRNDREHNRRFHPRHNDDAYMSGYRAGYRQQGGVWPGRDDRRNDHDADDRRRDDRRNDRDADDRGRGVYDNRNPNGRYGNQNVQQIAYNNGLQEGLRVGEGDRVGRKGYRCTTSDLYKRGNAGYMSSYGDQNMYRQNFQQGYRTGYDRAYYGR